MTNPTTVVFSGDLSAERFSEPIPVPEWAGHVGLDIACPAGVSGTLTIQQSIHGDADGDWAVYSQDMENPTSPLETTYSGTARCDHVYNMEVHGPGFIRLHWVPSDGGTDEYFYDGSSDTTAPPLVNFAW